MPKSMADHGYSAEDKQQAAADACTAFCSGGDWSSTDPRTAMDEQELRQKVAAWNAANQRSNADKFAMTDYAEAAARGEAASAAQQAEEYAMLKAKIARLPDAVKREFLEEFSDGGDMTEMISRLHKLEAEDPRARLTDAQRALLTADGEAPTLLIGARVQLTGLQGRPELNGERGVCTEFVKAKARCAIRLDSMAEGDAPLAIRPCNVRRWAE